MKVVLLAGGAGTRISEESGFRPKYIKEWFSDYFLYTSDVTFDYTDNNKVTFHNGVTEPWKVTVVDTGLNTMTGGRIRRIEPYVGGETFMVTYGDGVCDVDICKLLEFHEAHGRTATLTSVIQKLFSTWKMIRRFWRQILWTGWQKRGSL